MEEGEGGAAVTCSSVEAGEVDDGLEGEFGGSRRVGPGGVEQVELLPAQSAGEVSIAAVAGQERGEVEGLGGAQQAVWPALLRLCGAGLDLADAGGEPAGR